MSIISLSDIEQMSYKDLIFMQKNPKIISDIRILTTRAFKCSLAGEEQGTARPGPGLAGL